MFKALVLIGQNPALVQVFHIYTGSSPTASYGSDRIQQANVSLVVVSIVEVPSNTSFRFILVFYCPSVTGVSEVKLRRNIVFTVFRIADSLFRSLDAFYVINEQVFTISGSYNTPLNIQFRTQIQSTRDSTFHNV